MIALLFAAIAIVTAWFTIRGYQVRLEAMATRDELSGAASRQIFSTLFEQVVRLGRSTGSPASLIALDIDEFKPINDQYGHAAAGDAVIRALAGMISEHVRDTDTLCRWGGDEFLILLGDCGLDDAVAIAEKIQATVAARADATLYRSKKYRSKKYRSKNRGRNRVTGD